MSRWLNSIAASGVALRGGGAKEQITAAFKAGGGPGALCPVVVNNKYPFTPGATAEATLAFVAGWQLSRASPIAWMVRDLVLPVLFVQAWTSNEFTWRGNQMTVAESDEAIGAAQ